jgi:glycosyltransferase involved in cell wall biosynthesis/CelD/BcsL family acetyltransferase involved in cellulose biosynthesis
MRLSALPAEHVALASDRTRSERAEVDSRIHVLFLIDLLVGVGGAEQALVRTARLLPKERYRCTIASFHVRRGLQFLLDSGCEIREFPLQHILRPASLAVAWQLSRFIRSQRVDVVHTFFQTADLWGGVIARLSGCPVLVSSRRDMGFLRSRLHGFAYRLLAPMFDQVHVVSDAVRRYTIEADRLDPSKVITIPNGIEVDSEHDRACDPRVRRELLGDRYSHVIVTVGNVRRVKGMDVMIRAAAEVCRTHPRALFLIVGNMHEPDYGRELAALATELGVQDNVQFFGESDRIESILRASDIFCLLSRTEGMSNALLEAMLCGLPSVATAVGGTPEVVEDGATGFLVASEDSHAAAQSIGRLLESRTLAKQMGAEARGAVEQRFSARAKVDDTARSYEALLAPTRPTVDLIRRPERLDSLEAGWQALIPATCNPVNQFPYSRAWAAGLRPEQRLHVFAAHTPGRTPALSAIAPLVSNSGASGWLTLLAAEMYERLDFVYSDESALRALAKAIAQTGRPVYLQRVPAHSKAVSILAETFAGRAFIVKREVTGSPWLSLDRTWLSPETHLNGGRRSDLRRAMRLAREMGEVRTEILSPADPETVPNLIDQVIRIEAAGWKGAMGSALAMDVQRRAFFHRCAIAAAERGALRIGFLRIGERTAAAQIAIQESGAFSLLRAGYDEEFSRCSPGALLTMESLRYAASQNLKVYEFNGQTEPWTRVWTDQEHACCSLRIYPFRMRGFAALAIDAAAHARARIAGKRT